MSGASKYTLARVSESLRIRLTEKRREEAEISRRLRRQQEASQRAALVTGLTVSSPADESAVVAEQTRLAPHCHRKLLELADLQFQLDALQSDACVVSWCAEQLAELGQMLKSAQAAADAGDWTMASDASSRVAASIEPMIVRSQDRQIAEDARCHIVESLIHVLQAQDFAVSIPDLSQAGDFNSDVVFRAVRPDRRSLSVRIPVSGNLVYAVAGYPARTVLGSDGRPAATCDEADDHLAAIHRQLADDCDVETDGLRWPGQDPARIRKRANELPEGGSPGPQSIGGV
jgi:hypothetical protein